MSKRVANTKYRELYIQFLKQEIPNIIQILTLPSFFGVLIKNNTFDFILLGITGLLIINYLTARLNKFIVSEYPISVKEPDGDHLMKQLNYRQEFAEYAYSNKSALLISIGVILITAAIVIIVRQNISI